MIRLGDLVMILDLHQQGLSVSAIARQLERDRKTVRKYIERGLAAPAYGPRQPRPTVVTPFVPYLRERVAVFPELTGSRLLREIKELGYAGGYTAVKDFLRTIRPKAVHAFERRFETPPGKQAQVDFAFFRTVFTDQPEAERIVWLFSMVLGHSRMMWGRFVAHQDLQTVLRCHIAAFEAFGGVPAEILYDRMKTAVLGEVEDQGIAYNRKLLDLATHYRFLPKACPPYRAKTKGKVERPFRYVREDFFLGRAFRNLDDLNAQFRHWLDTIANPRRHATTGRIVGKHFVEEKPYLKALPALPFSVVLTFDRRITRDGMVSVGGNLYSVPDSTRRRVVEVHTLANEIRILEDNQLIAVHPVLEGRGRRRIAGGHRTAPPPGNSMTVRKMPAPTAPAGAIVMPRSLAFYDAVARRLAGEGDRV